MKTPAIDMGLERTRVQVEQRHRELSRTPARYLSDAEREELRRCTEWMRKNARGWERGRGR